MKKSDPLPTANNELQVSAKLRRWLSTASSKRAGPEHFLWVIALALLADTSDAALKASLGEALLKDSADPGLTNLLPSGVTEQPEELTGQVQILAVETVSDTPSELPAPAPELWALNTYSESNSQITVTPEELGSANAAIEAPSEPEKLPEEAETPSETGSRKLYPVAPIGGGGGGGGASSVSLAPTGASGSVIKGYLDQAIV
jgi:hypothetical protein